MPTITGNYLMESFPFDSSDQGYDERGYPVYDRAVGSLMLRSTFEKFFSNGVFPSPGNALQISKAETGLVVNIQPGICIINGAMGGVTSDDAYALTLDTAAPQGNVCYGIMLHFDLRQEYRGVYFTVVRSEADTSPTAPAPDHTTPGVYELRLGNVVVPSGATNLSNATVTNEKGTDVCPFAAPFEEIDMETVIADAQSSAQEYLAQFNSFLADNIQFVQDAIDGTTAGNLQNQINELKESAGVDEDTVDNVTIGYAEIEGSLGVKKLFVKDDAITETKIADSAVTSGKIANKSVVAGKFGESAVDGSSIELDDSGSIALGEIPQDKRWYGFEGTNIDKIVNINNISQPNVSSSPFTNPCSNTEYTGDNARNIIQNCPKRGRLVTKSGKIYCFALWSHTTNTNTSSDYGCYFQTSLYDVSSNTYGSVNTIDLGGANSYNMLQKSQPYEDGNGNIIDYVAKYSSYNSTVDGESASSRNPTIKIFKITTNISSGVSQLEQVVNHKFTNCAFTSSSSGDLRPWTNRSGFVFAPDGTLFGNYYMNAMSGSTTTDNTLSFVMKDNVWTTSTLLRNGRALMYDPVADHVIYPAYNQEGFGGSVRVYKMTRDLSTADLNNDDYQQANKVNIYMCCSGDNAGDVYINNSYLDYPGKGMVLVAPEEMKDSLFGNVAVREGLITDLIWDTESNSYKERILLDVRDGVTVVPPVPSNVVYYNEETGLFLDVSFSSNSGFKTYVLDPVSKLKTTIVDYSKDGSGYITDSVKAHQRTVFDDGNVFATDDENVPSMNTYYYGKIFS